MSAAVFTDDELERIEQIAASDAPRSRLLSQLDPDEQFGNVEVFERRNGRLYRRGEAPSQ